MSALLQQKQTQQAQPEDLKQKPTIYVEVKLIDDADDDPFVDCESIRRDVMRSLADAFAQVKIGTQLDMGRFPLSLLIHGYFCSQASVTFRCT